LRPFAPIRAGFSLDIQAQVLMLAKLSDFRRHFAASSRHSAIGHQPSAIGHWLSAFRFQLSACSFQFSVFN
jgi:hypothetical protein